LQPSRHTTQLADGATVTEKLQAGQLTVKELVDFVPADV
jgi:hypothetical protein